MGKQVKVMRLDFEKRTGTEILAKLVLVAVVYTSRLLGGCSISSENKWSHASVFHFLTPEAQIRTEQDTQVTVDGIRVSGVDDWMKTTHIIVRCFCSSALRTSYCDRWSMTLTGDTMSSGARDVTAGAARRRRERRYRSFWRHELLAVKMATLTACHHSAQKKPAATHAATQTDVTYEEVTSATGLVNPQISITVVETPQAVGSFPLSDDFAASVYNQVNQEQIVTAMQTQVIDQKIPEFPVVEWIQEQISGTIDVIPQESATQRTTKQIVHVPVHQIQEQSTVTSLVNPQFSTSAVEAPQVADSFPLSDDFAAHMYNRVHQEQIVATVQPRVIFQEIPEVQDADSNTGRNCLAHRSASTGACATAHRNANCTRASPSNTRAERRHRFGELTVSYHYC